MNALFWNCLLYFGVYLPGDDAYTAPSLQDLIPILGREYYVQCQISMLASDFDKTPDMVISMKPNDGVDCKIMKWRYCDKPISETPEDGECGCNFKTEFPNGIYEYLFYYYIKSVDEKMHEKLFYCYADSDEGSIQTVIAKFHSTPQKRLVACKDPPLILKWDYAPTRKAIQDRYRIKSIVWKSHYEGKPTILATYNKNIKTGESKFESVGQDDKTIVQNASTIPQLMLMNLKAMKPSQTIEIVLTFDVQEKDFKKQLRRRRRASGTQYAAKTQISVDDTDGNGNTADLENITAIPFPITTDSTTTQAPTVTTDAADIMATTTSTATTTTATTTTTTTTTITTTTKSSTTATVTMQTTTPAPINVILKNSANFLNDSIELIIAEAPSSEALISLKIEESLTGSIVITCTITHLSFFGNPPVNLTIQRDGKLLVTRPAIYKLHYSTHPSGDKITCGLEGEALNCLHQDDLRKKNDEKSVKDDLEKLERPNQSIDVSLMMFMIQSMACIMLMLWVFSLLLDHIRFLIRKQKRQVDQIFRDVVRTSRHARIIAKPQQAVASPPKPQRMEKLFLETHAKIQRSHKKKVKQAKSTDESSGSSSNKSDKSGSDPDRVTQQEPE